MAKTFTAAFAQTPRTAQVITNAASSSVAGSTPTNTQLIATAGTEGSIVTSLGAVAGSTNSGASLLAWVSKDSGTTKTLVAAAGAAAYSNSTTTVRAHTAFESITETTPMRLEAGDELYVGSEVSGTFHFSAELTDY